MRSDIQRAALRATAKLVFSVSVFGCGGATAVDPSSHDDKAQDVHVIAPDRSSVSLEASQATVPSPTASTPITISAFDAGGLIGSRCRR